jgi:hypothetical protein
MDIHGTILANLHAAIASSARLPGQPVYSDTLKYWTDLLAEAQRLRPDTDQRSVATLDSLVERLGAEIAGFEAR